MPELERRLAMLIQEILLGNMFVLDELRAMPAELRKNNALQFMPNDLRRRDFYEAAIDLTVSFADQANSLPGDNDDFVDMMAIKANVTVIRVIAVLADSLGGMPPHIARMVRVLDMKVGPFSTRYRQIVGLPK